jgi:hypothetical protein
MMPTEKPDVPLALADPGKRYGGACRVHDDERGTASITGAEQALDQAAGDGWNVVSVDDDRAIVS